MMALDILLELVWIHFIADFILQNDKMATRKSSSIRWLGAHCMIYGSCFFGFGWKYALLNMAMHFLTDSVTSRGTALLWKHNERHWFFCLIGFDQAVHLTTLILTYLWLKG
jgi:hypothetical protein